MNVYKKMKSPVGQLTLIANDHGLTAILWEKEKPGRMKVELPVENKKHPVLLQAEAQLNEYFAGKRKTFNLKLDMNGTEFQKSVWRALLRIPFGQTRSYGELAKEIKKPLAMRAVGAANGRNPLSIIVPCHRVIGSDGKLVGFGGGLDIKEKLLRLERALP